MLRIYYRVNFVLGESRTSHFRSLWCSNRIDAESCFDRKIGKKFLKKMVVLFSSVDLFTNCYTKTEIGVNNKTALKCDSLHSPDKK